MDNDNQNRSPTSEEILVSAIEKFAWTALQETKRIDYVQVLIESSLDFDVAEESYKTWKRESEWVVLEGELRNLSAGNFDRRLVLDALYDIRQRYLDERQERKKASEESEPIHPEEQKMTPKSTSPSIIRIVYGLLLISMLLAIAVFGTYYGAVQFERIANDATNAGPNSPLKYEVKVNYDIAELIAAILAGVGVAAAGLGYAYRAIAGEGSSPENPSDIDPDDR